MPSQFVEMVLLHQMPQVLGPFKKLQVVVVLNIIPFGSKLILSMAGPLDSI